jgi:nucleotide-binding universal stress UspA family protein
MRVLAWIAPATWPAVVDALLERHGDDEITLVAAADAYADFPPGRLGGLLGRRPPKAGPKESELASEMARDLLRQASDKLGGDAEATVLIGPTERVITEAAADADHLVMARDGDRSRLGPPSLGDHSRFVIDHAPCTVELVWPGKAPGLATIPPPPDDARQRQPRGRSNA